jgi:hypothetical protein
VFARHGRIALGVTALVAATASRYLVFAVH